MPRLWLDDMRKPPFGYDLWAKTAKEAIKMLEWYGVKPEGIEHCSLDHDLAEEHYEAEPTGYTLPPPLDRSKYKELTGYAVVEWMRDNKSWVREIHVHTLSMRGGADMMNELRKHAPEGIVIKRVKPYTIG
jgi:hypothetical protein